MYLRIILRTFFLSLSYPHQIRKLLVKKEDREKAGLILEKQTEDILTALRKGGSHGMSR